MKKLAGRYGLKAEGFYALKVSFCRAQARDKDIGIKDDLYRIHRGYDESYRRYCQARIAALDAADFDHAHEAILQITGQQALLDNTPVIQKSITLRNPYTDVLNLLQIELMRRYRAGHDHDEATADRLRHALFLSINGIAAAMQRTG